MPRMQTHTTIPKLSLTCFILGDSTDAFLVEVANTKSVSAFKDDIKETQSPRFNHLAASQLTVWKVSIPEDATTPELRINDVEPRKKLSPWEKLSLVFNEALVDNHVHVLVQVPTGGPVHSTPRPFLTLNCLMRGDHPILLFQVKIAPTDNVVALREAIKEKKTPTLDHLSADALGLWNVSDDALQGDLESHILDVETSMLPTEKLCTLFPNELAEGRVHVVIKVLGEPDMTHPAEKAHHQIIEDANAAAAPSYVSNNPAKFKSEQEKYPIYNGRPANRSGPPIVIYHEAFAQLKDSLRDPNKVTDPLKLKRVDDTAKLCLASTDIYPSERERGNIVYPYICSLLEIELRENVATATGGKKKAESDALVEQGLDDKTFGEKVAIVGHLELKNELGVAGQYPVQNTLGLRKLLAADEYKEIRHASCSPCIIISIAGPYIMFGGAIFADIFVAETFTNFIYLGGTDEEIVTLSRIFAVVAQAFVTLKEYYRCLKLNRGTVNRLFPQPTYIANRRPQDLPTILRRFDYKGRKSDNYRRSLFEGKYNDHAVLIKFCQQYDGYARRIVADAGYAPELFFCERLQGGMIMVIMELVDGRDAFHRFGQNSATTIPSDLMNDVKAAISILHDKNLVFGDMRRPNILVKEGNDRLRALLIDFEWVGDADRAQYPPLLNNTGEIAWVGGVQPHGIMKKQHDLEMIDLLNHRVTVD